MILLTRGVEKLSCSAWIRETIHTSRGVITHFTWHEAVKYLDNVVNNCTALRVQDDTHFMSWHKACSQLHGLVMKGYCFIYKICNELKNSRVIIDVKLLY